MSQVNAQSGNHDNPHGVYTQDHQNWNNQAEQMRKQAQLDQDLARMRQEEECKRQEAARQRQAQNQQAQQRSKVQKKSQSASKARHGKVQPQTQSQSAPWSNIWALIGMVVGGAFAYPRMSGMDEKWWAIVFAAVLVGAIAGRFYKVIVFFIGLVVVLAIGALVLSVWSGWGQGSDLSLLPNSVNPWMG